MNINNIIGVTMFIIIAILGIVIIIGEKTKDDFIPLDNIEHILFLNPDIDNYCDVCFKECKKGRLVYCADFVGVDQNR